MPTLTIDLQDGFTGEDVIVRVNGREVSRLSGVHTKRMLGLAKSFEVAAPEGAVTLEIEVPGKARGTTEVREPHVGVSLKGSDVRFIANEKPFGYA